LISLKKQLCYQFWAPTAVLLWAPFLWFREHKESATKTLGAPKKYSNGETLRRRCTREKKKDFSAFKTKNIWSFFPPQHLSASALKCL
jgi:hypothetical protein